MQLNLLEKKPHIDSLCPEYAKWGARGEEEEIVVVVVTTATSAAIVAMEIVIAIAATAAAIVAMEMVIAIAATAAEVGVVIANAHLKCHFLKPPT